MNRLREEHYLNYDYLHLGYCPRCGKLEDVDCKCTEKQIKGWYEKRGYNL